VGDAAFERGSCARARSPSDAHVRVVALARACALVLLPVLLAGCSKDKDAASQAAAAQRPPPQVGVFTVVARAVPVVPTFVAQTESSRQVNIVARVSGFLDKIAYQEGATVKQGQVLFELDHKPFEAQVNAARGELQAQEARLSTAQANYGRVKPLAEQNALSQADLDKAKGELDSASAAVFSAKAKLEEARLNLGYATISSPVNGVTSRALQRQGAYINAVGDSANLTYVAALDPMWVTFSVSQNQMADYQRQRDTKQIQGPPNDKFEVEIVLPDGTVYPDKGAIDFSDPSFSQSTGSFMVRAVMPNRKATLRPGMFVTVKLKGAMRPDAVVIPQLAVQQGSKGHAVFVINENSVAEIRPVIVGEYFGDKDIVILTGLRAGDRVVTDGFARVQPGKPVTIAPAGAPAQPGQPSPPGPASAPAAAPAKPAA